MTPFRVKVDPSQGRGTRTQSQWRKVEEQLQQSNTRGVWRGLNTITGRSTVSGGGPESGDQVLANRLNQFFNRFDSVALPSPIHQSSSHLSATPHSTGDMKCTSPVPLFLFLQRLYWV